MLTFCLARLYVLRRVLARGGENGYRFGGDRHRFGESRFGGGERRRTGMMLAARDIP